MCNWTEKDLSKKTAKTDLVGANIGLTEAAIVAFQEVTLTSIGYFLHFYGRLQR